MCDIVTGLMVASTVLSTAGSIQEGNAQAANQLYQRDVALMNADFIDAQIQDAADRGAEEVRRVRRAGAGVVGKQRAALGAVGIDLSFGSPLDFIVGTAAEIEMDAFRAEQNSAREIQDLGQKKYNTLAEAGALKAGAANARTAGVLNAAGSALSGGASIYKYRASLKGM